MPAPTLEELFDTYLDKLSKASSGAADTDGFLVAGSDVNTALVNLVTQLKTEFLAAQADIETLQNP